MHCLNNSTHVRPEHVVSEFYYVRTRPENLGSELCYVRSQLLQKYFGFTKSMVESYYGIAHVSIGKVNHRVEEESSG